MTNICKNTADIPSINKGSRKKCTIFKSSAFYFRRFEEFNENAVQQVKKKNQNKKAAAHCNAQRTGVIICNMRIGPKSNGCM